MITIELLLTNNYDRIDEQREVDDIVERYSMPFEYLDFIMFVNYEHDGRIDCIFGCTKTEIKDENLQLLVTDDTLRIYEGSQTIQDAIVEILQELI